MDVVYHTQKIQILFSLHALVDLKQEIVLQYIFAFTIIINMMSINEQSVKINILDNK